MHARASEAELDGGTVAPARLGPAKLAAFSLPNLPMAAIGLPLTVYLPAYFSTVVGISLAAIGAVFFAVRVLDMVVDPLVGVLVERTRTRFGQCRPWIAFGALLCTIGTAMLFWARPGATTWQLGVGLLLLYGGTSATTIAHSAWAGRIAEDYDRRSVIWGWVQLSGSIGSFGIIVLPIVAALFLTLGRGEDVNLMGWVLVFAIPLSCLICFVAVREPEPVSEGPVARHASLKDYLFLLRHPVTGRIALADLLTALAQGTTAALFLFFWAQKGYTPANVSTMIVSYMLGGILGIPFWVRAAKRWSKHRALMAALLAYALIIPGAALMPGGMLWAVCVLQFALGVTFAAGMFLLRAMASDAGDVARLRLGRDGLGQIYALLTSTQKFGSAIAIGASYSILAWAGFVAAAGIANPTAAQQTLTGLYVLVSGVLMLLAALALWGYTLGKNEQHALATGQVDGDVA